MVELEKWTIKLNPDKSIIYLLKEKVTNLRIWVVLLYSLMEDNDYMMMVQVRLIGTFVQFWSFRSNSFADSMNFVNCIRNRWFALFLLIYFYFSYLCPQHLVLILLNEFLSPLLPVIEFSFYIFRRKEEERGEREEAIYSLKEEMISLSQLTLGQIMQNSKAPSFCTETPYICIAMQIIPLLFRNKYIWVR